MSRKRARKAETPVIDRGLINPVLSFEERKTRMTARSHFLRRIRRLPRPTAEQIAEMIRTTTVPVRRFAPGAHAGWRPAFMRNP